VGDFDELQGHDPAAEDDLTAKAEKKAEKAEEPKPEPPKPEPPKPSHSSSDKDKH